MTMATPSSQPAQTMHNVYYVKLHNKNIKDVKSAIGFSPEPLRLSLELWPFFILPLTPSVKSEFEKFTLNQENAS